MTAKQAPPKPGLASTVSKPYGVGPLKLPLWGWVAVAVVAYYLYKNYASGADAGTTDLGYGGAAMAGPSGGGGGGQTGDASRDHHHRHRRRHHHRGGRQQTHTHRQTLPADRRGHDSRAGAGLPRHRSARSSR